MPRFTFGTDFLRTGFQFLPVLIGMFAFAQIMSDLEKMGGRRRPAGRPWRQPPRCPTWRVIWEILSRPFLLLWSTIIGLLDRRAAGDRRQRGQRDGLRPGQEVLPASGEFGTGIPEGIIASEASNNSNVAGSLVTIMAFGIPGDAVTAVMLGAMTIHGIQPGPALHDASSPRWPTASSPPTSWPIPS